MRPGKVNFDVIIIGAGPAGLSAAVWCADLGLSAAVFEKQREAGGQLLSIYNPINNYPGVAAENGRELRDRFLKTVDAFRIPITFSTEVVEIDVENTAVKTADGLRYFARFIIVATGVRRRRLNIPGEEEFWGKGIIESGSRDKLSVRDKIVAIVGGGDAALENAMILAEHAARVHVIHRNNKFRAREDFVKKAAENPKIEFVFDTVLTEINGTDSVESIAVINQQTLKKNHLRIEAILIRIGVEPNSELLKDKADLDPAGYICVDPLGKTSANRVYAIGDVANPIALTTATAAGTGATTAKAISDWIKHKKWL